MSRMRSSTLQDYKERHSYGRSLRHPSWTQPPSKYGKDVVGPDGRYRDQHRRPVHKGQVGQVGTATMAIPTTAAGWAQINTQANTWTNTTTTTPIFRSYITNNASTGTLTQMYYQPFSYCINNDQPELSSKAMIAALERSGHVVLKKQQIAVIAPPKWVDLVNEPMADISQSIVYGYALPEKEGQYVMPDGSTLKVDQYGNYQVLDQDAKVTYKANRIREFNAYISASDLLEAFIK